MKKFLLKEYGSWTVMLLSYSVGLDYSAGWPVIFAGLLGAGLLINSKQALTLWFRQRNRSDALGALVVQVTGGALILIIAGGPGLFRLLPWGLIPLFYLVSLISAGEHRIYTEILGFATLTLSVVLGQFLTAGEVSPILYLGVATFFIAGVFKVRVHLRKGKKERIMMVSYLSCLLFVYAFSGLSLAPLTPLIENLLHAIGLYRQKLRTVGWMEVLKGVVFVILIRLYIQ
jgi:hypothetical protein